MEVKPLGDFQALILSNEELAEIRAALFPVPIKDPLNVQLNKVDFDFDVLRIMVNAKLRRMPKLPNKPNDEGYRTLSKMLGIADTSLRNFCHGDYASLTVRSTVRLMAWVGYTDLIEFLKEE